MPLDYAITSATTKHPPREDYVGSFSEEAYDALFRDETVIHKLCPQLLKLTTYYADARYRGGELEALANGLAKSLPRFADRPAVAAELTRLIDAGRTALARGQSLLFIPD
jgi:hypothetical protein